MKGDIWFVELPSSDAREQSGKRPCIIISEVEANIVIIVPITANVQALRFPHAIEIEPSEGNGLEELSIALVFQLRAIDKKRLASKVGKLDEQKMGEIDKMIKSMLDV